MFFEEKLRQKTFQPSSIMRSDPPELHEHDTKRKVNITRYHHRFLKFAILACIGSGLYFYPRINWEMEKPQFDSGRMHGKLPPKTNYAEYQDRGRFLYLQYGNGGLNNQLECLHLGANLALKYNRTLLTLPDAYIGPKYGPSLGFDQIFDDKNIPMSILHLSDTNQFKNSSSPFYHCNDNHRIEKKHDVRLPLGNPLGQHRDNISQTCVSFQCSWAHLHLSAPKASFPYIDDNILPLNSNYRRIADLVLKSMKEFVLRNTSKSEKDVRILGIHKRGGDNPGSPSVDCAKTKGYPYLVASRISREGSSWSWISVYCSSTVGGVNGILSWETFFSHLNNCDGEVPICIKNYDVVYFATNDKRFNYPNRHNIYTLLNRTKVFYLEDFPFVREELTKTGLGSSMNQSRAKIHPLALFLVEMSILIRTSFFQSSVPSSISDIVYHYRQESGLDTDALPYINWFKMYSKLLFYKFGREACGDPCF